MKESIEYQQGFNDGMKRVLDDIRSDKLAQSSNTPTPDSLQSLLDEFESFDSICNVCKSGIKSFLRKTYRKVYDMAHDEGESCAEADHAFPDEDGHNCECFQAGQSAHKKEVLEFIEKMKHTDISCDESNEGCWYNSALADLKTTLTK